MARKKKETEERIENFIQEQVITDTLRLNYMPYAMSVIVSRAIPEIDGFKPSHRKLLYTMYLMNLLKGERTKSSNVVGQTMKLNPHGDAAIYETMVRLTEGNGALLLPFVDSKGNFGKQYSRDMAYAAPRYTEVKLAKVCAEIFRDIDKDTVDFVDNFDGTMKEPTLLPTTFPNILVNPNLGIAVGMASSICSFNLSEVCDAAMAYLKDENANMGDYLKGPDFSTGGQVVYDEKEFQKIYETGRGSFKLRAKYRFDEKHNCIEIYEIPYSTNIETIIDKVIQLVKTGKIKEVTDIRDETDLNGLKIAIDVKKSTNVELLMNKLYTLTPLSDNFSCNFNVLIDGTPMTLGIKGILHYWTEFRLNSIRRQLRFDQQKKAEKKHLLEGLAKILLDIDKAIHIIRHTELESMVVPNLMEGFGIDEVQAEYIADMKLRNINQEYILKRLEEMETLEKELADIEATLKSEAKLRGVITEQLKQVQKDYGAERKTEIIQPEEIVSLSKEEMIEDYGIKVFLSRDNYFKKITLQSLRFAGEHKMKEEDEILWEEECTNRSDILFFSDQFNLYKCRAHELAETKTSVLGDYLPNLLGMEAEEKIIYMTTTLDYSGSMLFVFENGKAAKVSLSSYATKANRKKLVNAYSNKSPLVFALKMDEEQDIVLLRNYDKATLIHTELIPLNASKSSQGVQVFKLTKNSKVTKAYRAEDFQSEDREYYRGSKIPSSGHYIREKDKTDNQLPAQINLLD